MTRRDPHGSYTCSGFASQPKSVALREFIIFMVSSKQTCSLFDRRQDCSLQIKTLRNGPGQEGSGSCILGLHSRGEQCPRWAASSNTHCFIFISASSFPICPISLFTPISWCSGSARMAGPSLSVIYCYFPNNDNTWPDPARYSINAPRVNHRTDLNFQHRPQILHSVQTEFLADPKHTWPHDFCLRELTSPLLLHSLTHPQSLAQSPSFNVLPP